MRGGRGALGILPGLLVPAIAEGLRHGQDLQADQPPHPRTKKVARRRPPRERMIVAEPKVERPRHRRIAEPQPAPERAPAKRLATVNPALFLPLNLFLEAARRHAVDHALAQRADGLVDHRESSFLACG